MTTCRHCRRRNPNRPRRLCWTCYYAPGIRDRYRPISKFARRGPGNAYRTAPLPSCPTDAEPGSPEKLRVLAQRVLEGVQLFHHDDADPLMVMAVAG